MKKVILIVLDSVGIGAAPDAAAYDDAGAATLQHIAAHENQGLHLPVLQAMGLGNIPGLLPGIEPIAGVSPVAQPSADFGALQEMSEGKDTITGHWEIAGLMMNPGFSLFPPDPPSFPDKLIRPFEQATGRKIIGNKAASGTVIIEELGPEHIRTGAWIVYTSGDSVFQIAAHNDVIPLQELYRGCEIARDLCNPYRIGRVIARPFRGRPGAFERTSDRVDYAYTPPEPTVLEQLKDGGVPIYAIGKIEDIYARRGISESVHSGDMAAAREQVEQFTREKDGGLIFANFIDFDMKYGHRRDPVGYARALVETDAWMASYLPLLDQDDLLILTADHGNDPTFKGTDHTREYVPLLVHRLGQPGRNLGVRQGFFDLAQSLADFFGLPARARGKSFILP